MSFILLQGCNDKSIEYQYTTAFVFKTEPIHWGRGFYKLLVYYEFHYNNKVYQDKYKDNRLAHIYGMRFNEGDSVIIKFPKGNIEKSTIVKRIYINSSL